MGFTFSEILAHPVVAMIVLLGVLVFVHEFGHYIVAKFCGVGVEVFSIGFGPKLLSYRYNHTTYQIAAIPLGGYVKLAGAFVEEDVPEVYRGKEFFKASLLSRSAILIAGPFANLMLACLVYAILGFGGTKHPAAIVGSVKKLSPAMLAGFEPGDKILEIAGHKIKKWSDMQDIISESANKSLPILVSRGGQVVSFDVIPKPTKKTNSWDIFPKGKGQIGIGYGSIASVITVHSPDSLAFQLGFRTADNIKKIKYKPKSLAQEQVLFVKDWSDIVRGFQKLLSLNSEIREQISFVVEREDENAQVTEEIVAIKPTTVSLTNRAFKEKNYYKVESWLKNVLGINDSELTIGSVGSLSEKVLQPDDTIISLNQKKINDIYDLSDFFQTNAFDSITVSFLRGAEQIVRTIPLKPVERQEPSGKKIYYILDAEFLPKRIFPDPIVEKHDTFIKALSYGIRVTMEQTSMIFQSLLALFSGKLPLQSLGGPIMIAKVAGDSARAGWEVFLSTMAVISINLGIINLFPIPVLDGGQLVLVACEAIKRRPLSIVFIENFQKIGFVLLLSLMLLATYNDISRFWASMLRGVLGNS